MFVLILWLLYPGTGLQKIEGISSEELCDNFGQDFVNKAEEDDLKADFICLDTTPQKQQIKNVIHSENQ